MTRTLRARAAWMAAALLTAAACGGGNDASSSAAGITRATPADAAPRSSAPADAFATRTAVPRATGAPAFTPVAAPATVDPTFGAWAASVCETTARFDDAVAAVQDGIDPGTLGLSERVTRARTRYGAYLEALGAQAEALAAITPPPDAQPYQAALRTQVSELQRLFTEQLAMLDHVVLASEMDDGTVGLQAEVVKLEHSLALVRSLLPDAAQAALSAPARCGQILG